MVRDCIDSSQKQGEDAGKQGMHRTPQQLLESHKRLRGGSEYSQKACENAEKTLLHSEKYLSVQATP